MDKLQEPNWIPLCIKLHNDSDQLTLQEQLRLSFNRLLKDKNLTKNAREENEETQ